MISKAPQTLLEFYAERVQHEESGLSASTIKCRRESIKRFSGFLDREALISDLSAAVLASSVNLAEIWLRTRFKPLIR